MTRDALQPEPAPRPIAFYVAAVLLGIALIALIFAGAAPADPQPDADGKYNVRAWGAKGDGKADDTAAILAAGRAATDAGPGRTVFFPPGRFMVSTLRMAGLSCSLVGSGDATTIAALPGQSLPVVDFPGYLSPESFCDLRVGLEKVRIEGDGTPGPDKAGVRLGHPSVGSGGVVGLIFRDFSVSRTGGPALDVAQSELCNFERITLVTPVACVANDVPYIVGAGAFNGNALYRIGLRSMTPRGDCPKGGAARFVQHPTLSFAPAFNLFSGWWHEYLHPSDGSALFVLQGNYNTIRDCQYFDTTKEDGAAGTAAFRLLQPAKGREDYGANVLATFHYGGAPGSLDVGAEVSQPFNGLLGPMGKGGKNVMLLPAAMGKTDVDFCGSEQGGDPGSGVVDAKGRPVRLKKAG